MVLLISVEGVLAFEGSMDLGIMNDVINIGVGQKPSLSQKINIFAKQGSRYLHGQKWKDIQSNSSKIVL